MKFYKGHGDKFLQILLPHFQIERNGRRRFIIAQFCRLYRPCKDKPSIQQEYIEYLRNQNESKVCIKDKL